MVWGFSDGKERKKKRNIIIDQFFQRKQKKKEGKGKGKEKEGKEKKPFLWKLKSQ